MPCTPASQPPMTMPAPELEGERVAAVPGGVELLPGGVADADVVDVDGVPGGGLGAVAHDEVVDLQVGGGVALGDGRRRASRWVRSCPRSRYRRPLRRPYRARVIRWRAGTVTALGRGWSGAQECTVTLDETAAAVRALAYPGLVGDAGGRRPRPAEHHRAGPGAGHRGVRAGGGPARPAARRPRRPAGGHLVKARYTPLQATVLGRGRAGVAAPRRAARRGLPRRHAGGRRRPALRAAGGPGRCPRGRRRPRAWCT